MSSNTHEICPQCGSDALAEIVYGYPSPELLDLVDEGSVILGGCIQEMSDEMNGTPQVCQHCDWYSGMPDRSDPE